MIWIEMTNPATHSDGAWGFTNSVWSPARKKGGARTAYWENVLRVKEGDLVVHLDLSKQCFVGHSVAQTDGFETDSEPDDAGEWAGYGRYHRAFLTGFSEFREPIPLAQLWKNRDKELRSYFAHNRASHGKKKTIFFAVQDGELQCQTGGYLTELDHELLEIVFAVPIGPSGVDTPVQSVNTKTVTREFQARVGQQGFSDKQKANYGRCCFPGCNVTDEKFLVGAHIARWSDVPELRGVISNGLCLCLMHDKAFELGLFTLTADYKVCLGPMLEKYKPDDWFIQNVAKRAGEEISKSPVLPSLEALQHHWDRIRLKP